MDYNPTLVYFVQIFTVLTVVSMDWFLGLLTFSNFLSILNFWHHNMLQVHLVISPL